MLFDIVTAGHFLHIVVRTPKEEDKRGLTVVRVKGSWLMLKRDSESSVAPHAELCLIDKANYLWFSSADEHYSPLAQYRGPQSCFLLRGGLSDHPGNLFELYLLKLILLGHEVASTNDPPSPLPRRPEISSRGKRRTVQSRISFCSSKTNLRL